MSELWPVELTSRLPVIILGPMIVPSAIAAFMQASIPFGEPAPITPVKPHSSAVLRLLAARTACSGAGASRPSGALPSPIFQ